MQNKMITLHEHRKYYAVSCYNIFVRALSNNDIVVNADGPQSNSSSHFITKHSLLKSTQIA